MTEMRKKNMVDKWTEEAKNNYKKLLNPCMNLETYTKFFVNDETNKDVAKKLARMSFSLSNPPPEYRAASDFLISYPQSYLLELRKNRNAIWKEIDFENIKNKWVAVLRERNRFSLSSGFKSRIEMYLNDLKIPKSVFKKFRDDLGKVIDYINGELTLDPKMFSEIESNNYCFICRMDFFSIKDTNELFSIFIKKYPILGKNKDKVKIIMAEQNPKTRYVKESDSFEVFLDKRLSLRHQIVDLIHELSHVVALLRSFKHGQLVKGKYMAEKKAIEIELDFMKKYFPDIFYAKLGNILQTIQVNLFELEMYRDPNKDPDKLYAECFNRCFKGAEQKTNRGYLLNMDVVYRSFADLAYGVAYIEVLATII